ncbi:conserved hypothetical protein [Brucella abortus bv. 4 str. 292]|uniref:peptidoglycan hydrolase inhibitor PhiA n=1 Tax=Brucella abortus TaxID=235 RepID=UPI0001B96297|nr:peptidoglycan hydrolase inhibitor PhiA [Brucella abortus]AIJ53177.1 putative formate/nitrite transporter [Brucella abortus]EEX56444.1 conserved hypothetical protein [Brucella abortus bv. 4 str. 292]KFJ63134.1 putative formate/nitrite transporter [Brucella abortus bv. 4 str. 292]
MIDFKAIPVFSELLNRTSHLFYRIIRRNAVSRFWPENAVGKKITASALLAVALMPVSAHAQADEEQPPIERVDYICERSVVVPVTYIRSNGAPAAAVLEVEGKMVALQWHGDLKKYVAIDEQDSYRWADRGGQATLSHLEADHTAKEVTLLSACRADTAEE